MSAAYYKYKKESLTLKFNMAKDTLHLIKDATEQYKNGQSVHLKRAIIGYFQDFSEYIIDMSETYLVMTNNYIDGCSGLELIKKSSLYGFIDEKLSRILVALVRLRNRYTHDYYKRERVEEDILDYCINKIAFLEIFLEVSNEKIKLSMIEEE
ncbi:HepT-like ribonuclease domain-containing protein [Clostridium senegalense]